jgi:hypothetical protein
MRYARLNQYALTTALCISMVSASPVWAADEMFDLEELRCQTAAIQDEAHLLGCIARCQEQTAAGDHATREACQHRCAVPYTQARSQQQCAEPVGLLFVPALASADARALACHARRTVAEHKLALCHGDCAQRTIASGINDAHESRCEQACQTIFEHRLARLAPQGECPFVAAAEQEYQVPLAAFPSAPVPTLQRSIRTPAGVIEATLEVRDGYGVFEGDILIDLAPDAEVDRHAEDEHGQGAAAASSFRRWPNGVVPFEIAANLPNKWRVWNALIHWTAHTPLRFKPRTTEADFVRFVPDTGCSSFVGRQGGMQPIKLASGCSTGSTIHEIGHAVGLFHEQSRADRDKNVIVKWQFIQPGREHNFRTYVETNQAGTDIGPFNWNSIMLYDSCAFSIAPVPYPFCLPTMLRKSPLGLFSAQRQGLSLLDLVSITIMYQ